MMALSQEAKELPRVAGDATATGGMATTTTNATNKTNHMTHASTEAALSHSERRSPPTPPLATDPRDDTLVKALAAAYPLHAEAGLLPCSGAHRGQRILDLVIAAMALVVALPLCPFIALAIRLDSACPALFRQLRVGKDGHLFVMYKFRTMRSMPSADAEATSRAIMERWMAGMPLQTLAAPATSASNGKAQSASSSPPPFKLTTDPRITRVGRVLRKTSLDELPQLLNVVRGEMSIVGPRPPLPMELERYSTRALARLRVRPGITGSWQVKGRGWMTFDQMIDLDLEYVQRSGLRRDIAIILRTIPAVLRTRGAG